MFVNWYAELNLFSLATFLPVSDVTQEGKQKSKASRVPDYLVNRVPKKLRGYPGEKFIRNREIAVH